MKKKAYKKLIQHIQNDDGNDKITSISFFKNTELDPTTDVMTKELPLEPGEIDDNDWPNLTIRVTKSGTKHDSHVLAHVEKSGEQICVIIEYNCGSAEDVLKMTDSSIQAFESMITCEVIDLMKYNGYQNIPIIICDHDGDGHEYQMQGNPISILGNGNFQQRTGYINGHPVRLINRFAHYKERPRLQAHRDALKQRLLALLAEIQGKDSITGKQIIHQARQLIHQYQRHDSPQTELNRQIGSAVMCLSMMVKTYEHSNKMVLDEYLGNIFRAVLVMDGIDPDSIGKDYDEIKK